MQKLLSYKVMYSIELPISAELEVTYTEPGFAGNTTNLNILENQQISYKKWIRNICTNVYKYWRCYKSRQQVKQANTWKEFNIKNKLRACFSFFIAFLDI